MCRLCVGSFLKVGPDFNPGDIPLEDGSYDVMIIDSDITEIKGRYHIDVTVLGGPNKGDVLSLTARDLTDDPIDLLGLPATLIVRDGTPDLVIER